MSRIRDERVTEIDQQVDEALAWAKNALNLPAPTVALDTLPVVSSLVGYITDLLADRAAYRESLRAIAEKRAPSHTLRKMARSALETKEEA